ncbi:siderophore-interacting protein [Actinoplanes sp. NPDC049265]|uniref:siderophore-interacting protein n=1 Tax=Actinoplanes sp. NPDC049265 TaxID=3363902 RepID=UPI003723A2BD
MSWDILPKVQLPSARRMITLTVLRTEQTTPSFRTVTLGGPDLGHLVVTGFDQTVRLFFPRLGQRSLRMPTLNSEAWMAQVLLLPKSVRPWVRNYTIRRARPGEQEIDIEFALHGEGPAAAWATSARPGDEAGIWDMGISYLPPAEAEWHLLAGEESAVPAILSILENASDALTAEVFLEVPSPADIRTDILAPPGARIHWLPRREGLGRPGALALATIKEAILPAGRSYTWVAGESKLPTGLRRHLVNDRGVAKSDIAFFGYWRHGRSSPG